MPFTTTEVESVIERLVRSSIRRPYDTLGVRRTDVTFNDIQESAAGVFLMYPRAPFHFVGLATSRLEDLVAAVDLKCSEIASTLAVLRRRVVPVKDVTALANARAALGELEAAVTRNGPPRDVTKVPAFVRFNANVDRFLGAVGQNIKSGGDIVPTPNEARAKLPGLVAELEELMTSIVEKVTYVAGAMTDFGSLSLPQLVSGGVISRARQVLGDRVDQLEAMNETERLEVLRETVLEVLGTRAVVKRFGQFTPPTSLADLTGVGAPFSDTDRPANEAYLDVATAGPYSLVAGVDAATSSNVLRLYLDGAPSWPSAPSTEFFLPQSAVAKIEGLQTGPFNIVAGINDLMKVIVNGVTVPVVLTAGARTATEVAADITTALAATNFKAEPYFMPLMYEGEVTLAFEATTPGYTDMVLAYGKFPANSIAIGDEVDFYYGVNAGVTATVVDVLPSVADPQIIQLGGMYTDGTARMRYGSSARRVRITAIDKALSVQNKETLQLSMPTAVERDAGITLGMYGELLGRSLPTDAEVVANYVNANSKTFRALTVFEPTVFVTRFRTMPEDAMALVAYDWRGSASWGAGTVGVVVELEEDPMVDLVGQTICLRDGAEPDATGLVTAQTGATLTVTFGSAVTAAQGAVEVGPTTGLEADQVLLLSDGPNAGRYYIDSVSSSVPFQVKLRSMPPVYRDGFNQPHLARGLVGTEALRFFSRTASLSSYVELYDPLTVFFPIAGPHEGSGTTHFFKLPSKPRDLEPGDILEFFYTDYETPAMTRLITEVFDDGVVELDEAIPSLGSYTFGTTTLPFARLRTDRVVAFDEYKEALEVWLLEPNANVRSTFIDVNRFIQPLLVNQNPTDTDVGSAENRIEEIRSILIGDAATTLSSILDSYESPFINEADALIRAFKEKGADRAIDILLDCRFTTFFGLDQEQTSYAGAFQKAVRDVARNDLPIRKLDRAEATRGRLIASVESVDYETSTADLDEMPDIDPPVDVG